MLPAALCILFAARAAGGPSPSDTAAALQQARIDPEQAYRIRELQLSRGDIRIYLTDGLLSFVTPVAGHTFAAVFTTLTSDTGDAEILVLPPQRSERASLASFTESPNLDQHFTTALFLFSDDTAAELLRQIHENSLRKAPQLAIDLAPQLDPAIHELISQINVSLVGSLLDNHKAADGFFYSLVSAPHLGKFDVLYDPSEFEPVAIGRLATGAGGQPAFQLWTSFRPRHAPPFVPLPVRITDYSIDSTIRPDLSLIANARFRYTPDAADGAVLSFALSEKLTVVSAEVDDKPAEVFQSNAPLSASPTPPRTFLLVTQSPPAANQPHHIQITYQGAVIKKTGEGSYFVDERTSWYPLNGTMLTNFDLTFHCPESLRLVSTGELVNEQVSNGIRTVHRRTQRPEHLAGFNLGDYELLTDSRGPYRIECFSNKTAPKQDPHLVAQQAAATLTDYSRRWMELPIHSLAVSPVPAYFGQGFPGLIYLSELAYVRPEDRPPQLRNQRLDTFFSEMLLPHEVAHQWWGNLIVAADYRAAWLMEAMANYSALQLLEQEKGESAVESVLTQYRDDLLRQENGKSIESAGPVDFGSRLLDNAGMPTWHIILYEKGTWILHMLRARMGDAAFSRMQTRLLDKFASTPFTNEGFRNVASEFVPADESDKNLTVFFDAWIYGTGIPHLELRASDLEVSGVDEDFTADIPLHCRSKSGKEEIRWVRATSGSNPVDSNPRSACELPHPEEFLYQP